MLTHAGINANANDDILTAIWMKMIFASPLMGVTAITRSPIGVIRSIPETRDILGQSMQETVQVAQKLGYKFPENIVNSMMKGMDAMPENSTTSMQRDMIEGRQSELDSFVGAVVRIGKEINIDTPVNHFLYYSLLPIELRAKGDLV